MYIQVSILCIIILDILVILHPCSMLSRWQLAFYSQNIWSQLMHTQNLLDQRLFGHESCYESITPSRHTSWSSITSQKLAGVELSILGFTVLSRGQRFRSTDHRHPSKLEAARAADVEGCWPVNSYWSFVVMKNGIQLLGPCVSLFAWTERC